MALRTLGQLTPKYRSHLKMTWMHPELPLTPGWLFLPWHLIAFPTRKTTSASPTSLLVHLLFPSRANPQNTLSENLLSFHVKVQSQGHSLASILSFFFSSVKCPYILSKNIPCTGTVTLCILFPHSRQQQKLLREEGRRKGQTGGGGTKWSVWWRKEI